MNVTIDSRVHSRTKPRLLVALISSAFLIAGLSWIAPESADADHSDCPRFRKPARAMKQEVGRMFRYDNFRDNKTDSNGAVAGDGVPNQFSASSDYQTTNASGHCLRRVFQPKAFADGNTVLHQKIFEGVSHSPKKSGDVSVYITYKAREGHTFRATASVNLFQDGGDFRGRLKIVGLDGNMKQVKPEYNTDICQPRPEGTQEPEDPLCEVYDGGEYQTISVLGEMCPGTRFVNVVFRARENQTEGAYGTAALDWIEFERVPNQSLGKCN